MSPRRPSIARKKTGAGHLFMVFGEPDIEVRETEGSMTVEIRGLDVYDPTTGVIRSHSVDDIVPSASCSSDIVDITWRGN